MSDNNINTGGGSLNLIGSAIGSKNQISGNSFNISDSLNISPSPNRDEFLSALKQLQGELSKIKDLPEDDLSDLKTNMNDAIQATERSKPSMERAVEKLSTMQKIIDKLKDNFASALALGGLLSQVLSVASKVAF